MSLNPTTGLPEQPAGPPPENGIGVDWEWISDEGTSGSMTFGDQPDNKLIARAEKVRKEIKAAPVYYLVVDVNNMAGTSDSNMYQVAVVDNDGNQYEAVSLDSLNWLDQVDVNNTDAYNDVVNLENDSTFFLHPGAKGTAVMAFKKNPPSVMRVFVYPDGGLTDTEADWQ